jgi:hypothetical protein
MEYALEALPDGRRIRLEPDHPLVLTVRRGADASGSITVGVKDGKPYLDNRSNATCTVNGVEHVAALLAMGDELHLGNRTFRVVSLAPASQRSPLPEIGEVDVVEPQAQATAAATSETARQQRRISASRMVPVEPQPSGSNILRKVSSVFSGRAERGRLEQLENERRVALAEAGRRSLQDGGPFGIPAAAMRLLMSGQAATVRPQDCENFQRWRDDRQRLVRLDAEIAALRAALNLGPDPDAVVLTAPSLRSDDLAHEERVYATMDDVGTQPIEGYGYDAPVPPPTARKPATSVRKRT